MSNDPTSPRFRARCGSADPGDCSCCDRCSERPTPPPKHGYDVCLLPDEPLSLAALLARAPLSVVIAAFGTRS